jgi:hypothetical protein
MPLTEPTSSAYFVPRTWIQNQYGTGTTATTHITTASNTLLNNQWLAPHAGLGTGSVPIITDATWWPTTVGTSSAYFVPPTWMLDQYTPNLQIQTNPQWAGTSVFNSGSYRPPRPETKKHRRKRLIQQRLDDLAAQRAKALLLEHLTEEQRREYEEQQYFHVLGQGGRMYRIKHGSAGNVYRIGLDGNVEAKFCIHAVDSVPHEDNMLSQMLLLMYDEERFLTVANKHW